jgi:hypothetical protein
LTLQSDSHRRIAEQLEECQAQIKSNHKQVQSQNALWLSLKCGAMINRKWKSIKPRIIENQILSSSAQPSLNSKQMQFDEGYQISNLKFQILRSMLNNIFLFDCSLDFGLGALPPCVAGIPLDAAASNAIASCKSDSFQIARFGSDLIDVSIYVDKDSSIFKTQAKQPLRYL